MVNSIKRLRHSERIEPGFYWFFVYDQTWVGHLTEDSPGEVIFHSASDVRNGCNDIEGGRWGRNAFWSEGAIWIIPRCQIEICIRLKSGLEFLKYERKEVQCL